MNEAMYDSVRFEEFVKRALEALEYTVQRPAPITDPATKRVREIADFIATKSNKSAVIEVKYYTANSRPHALIGRAFLQVEKALEHRSGYSGIIVSNASLNSGRISELKARYGRRIEFWSIHDLAHKLVNHPRLIEEALYYGSEYSGQSDSRRPTPNEPSLVSSRSFDESRNEKITTLLNNLEECPVSKGPPFEKVCEKVLKFVFENQLTGWTTQNRTDNGLHKHDLVARVLNMGGGNNGAAAMNTAKEDFWSVISSHFNCRYITFEFKNYKKKIKQGEVLTTEKYLYLKALRSVAIIIARNGADKNAIRTMKGALREHGKLILCLDTKDLQNMLLKAQVGDDAQQILIRKLDKHLLTINR